MRGGGGGKVGPPPENVLWTPPPEKAPMSFCSWRVPRFLAGLGVEAGENGRFLGDVSAKMAVFSRHLACFFLDSFFSYLPSPGDLELARLWRLPFHKEWGGREINTEGMVWKVGKMGRVNLNTREVMGRKMNWENDGKSAPLPICTSICGKGGARLERRGDADVRDVRRRCGERRKNVFLREFQAKKFGLKSARIKETKKTNGAEMRAQCRP